MSTAIGGGKLRPRTTTDESMGVPDMMSFVESVDGEYYDDDDCLDEEEEEHPASGEHHESRDNEEPVTATATPVAMATTVATATSTTSLVGAVKTTFMKDLEYVCSLFSQYLPTSTSQSSLGASTSTTGATTTSTDHAAAENADEGPDGSSLTTLHILFVVGHIVLWILQTALSTFVFPKLLALCRLWLLYCWSEQLPSSSNSNNHENHHPVYKTATTITSTTASSLMGVTAAAAATTTSTTMKMSDPRASPPPVLIFLAFLTFTALLVHPDGLTWWILRQIRNAIVTTVQSSSTFWGIIVNDHGTVVCTLLALATFASLFFLAFVLGRLLQRRRQQKRPETSSSSGGRRQTTLTDKQKRKKRRNHHHHHHHHHSSRSSRSHPNRTRQQPQPLSSPSLSQPQAAEVQSRETQDVETHQTTRVRTIPPVLETNLDVHVSTTREAGVAPPAVTPATTSDAAVRMETETQTQPQNSEQQEELETVDLSSAAPVSSFFSSPTIFEEDGDEEKQSRKDATATTTTMAPMNRLPPVTEEETPLAPMLSVAFGSAIDPTPAAAGTTPAPVTPVATKKNSQSRDYQENHHDVVADMMPLLTNTTHSPSSQAETLDFILNCSASGSTVDSSTGTIMSDEHSLESNSFWGGAMAMSEQRAVNEDASSLDLEPPKNVKGAQRRRKKGGGSGGDGGTPKKNKKGKSPTAAASFKNNNKGRSQKSHQPSRRFGGENSSRETLIHGELKKSNAHSVPSTPSRWDALKPDRSSGTPTSSSTSTSYHHRRSPASQASSRQGGGKNQIHRKHSSRPSGVVGGQTVINGPSVAGARCDYDADPGYPGDDGMLPATASTPVRIHQNDVPHLGLSGNTLARTASAAVHKQKPPHVYSSPSALPKTQTTFSPPSPLSHTMMAPGSRWTDPPTATASLRGADSFLAFGNSTQVSGDASPLFTPIPLDSSPYSNSYYIGSRSTDDHGMGWTSAGLVVPDTASGGVSSPPTSSYPLRPPPGLVHNDAATGQDLSFFDSATKTATMTPPREALSTCLPLNGTFFSATPPSSSPSSSSAVPFGDILITHGHNQNPFAASPVETGIAPSSSPFATPTVRHLTTTSTTTMASDDEEEIVAELQELGGQMVGSILDY